MKRRTLCLVLLSLPALALESGYLKPEDQKYYKNDVMEGNNSRERIDSLVREVNKLYSEVAGLKSELQGLRSEVDALKKSK